MSYFITYCPGKQIVKKRKDFQTEVEVRDFLNTYYEAHGTEDWFYFEVIEGKLVSFIRSPIPTTVLRYVKADS